MTKIKLGKKTYNLELTLKDLRDFGFVPNNLEDNASKLGQIIAALKLGDAFTLVDVLSKLLAKEDVSEEEIENALANDKDTDALFDTLVDFFSEAPFTKKMMRTINTALDGAMDKLDKELKAED